MKKITLKESELVNLIEKALNEVIKVPIEIGDTVLGGKFKNKKTVVKDIDKNEKGDITLNSKPLLRFRTLKNEGMYVSKHGALLDDTKPYYPYNELTPSVENFRKKYKELMRLQGWDVFSSSDDMPNDIYDIQKRQNNPDYQTPHGYNLDYYKVEKVDDSEDFNTSDELSSDDEAWYLAKKAGLMLDDYGVIIGVNGLNFVDRYNK